jgi:small subunit ribosomal protein S3Ae
LTEEPKEKTEKAKTEEKQEKTAAKKTKWKGKVWFDILAPEEFGGMVLAQTPAIDPKTVAGRVVEVAVSDLLRDKAKYYMKMKFKVNKVSEKDARTVFNGFECIREHIFRMVRKRNDKVKTTFDVQTKDNWSLKVTSIAILRGNARASAVKGVRLLSEDIIKKTAEKSNVDELVKNVVNNSLQARIKKEGCKIHPIRFCDITKIKVMKAAG